MTGTIRSKIIDIKLYEDDPAILMFGMFSSLFAASTMLFVATLYGYPVSTTHDIVGSIMGFSIAARGFDSVEWEVAIKIFISWIISPVFAGTVAACIFASVKYAVLKSENTFQRAYRTFPIVLTLGIGINVFYVLYKATSNFKAFQDSLELYVILPVAFGSGAVCGLIWMFIVGPIAKRRVYAKREAREAHEAEAAKKLENAGQGDSEVLADEDGEPVKGQVFDVDGDEAKVAPEAPVEGQKDQVDSLFSKFAANTYGRDLHEESFHENTRAAEIWDEGIKYDEDTENLFTYLQVFTACLNSFAHGANDVSNTIAPMSAIIDIYQNGEVSKSTDVQKWVLAYGGIAIVLGLLIYGYNVMKSIGYKLTMMSPSRGFSAELGAALVVVTASFNEIPVSSTQCIVGAVFGVGLIGGCENVQWLFLLRVMISWAGLFICACIFSAGFFSFVAFAPKN